MVVISEITDNDNGDKKPQEPPGGETRILTTTWPMVSNVRIDFVTYVSKSEWISEDNRTYV